MPNAIAYIDGFNCYYGVKKTPYKWLDFGSLLAGMFPSYHFVAIKYFTAAVSARPSDPGQPIRQQTYWRALRTIPQLSIVKGSFIKKPRSWPIWRPDRYRLRAAICQWLCPVMTYSDDGVLLVRVQDTEEKGSDVNLAAHLVNDAHLNLFDEAIVFSGDSDLCEAVVIVTKTVRKAVTVVNPNPQAGPSRQLLKVASRYRHLHESELKGNQFPDSFPDVHGTITKPAGWS